MLTHTPRTMTPKLKPMCPCKATCSTTANHPLCRITCINFPFSSYASLSFITLELILLHAHTLSVTPQHRMAAPHFFLGRR